MTQNANVIGRNVARFRYQKGCSQDLLVTKMQLLGIYITRDILANIETLRTIATDKQIVVFAEVFGVPVGDLFPTKQKSSGRIVGFSGGISTPQTSLVPVFVSASLSSP
jgi:transcriptional regulator with XRE-family HTH domain